MRPHHLNIFRYPFLDNLRKRLFFYTWKIEQTFDHKTEIRNKYLIATNIGGNLNTLALDITLAKALQSRGHQVDITLCGGNFDACMNLEINKFKDLNDFQNRGTKALCKNCFPLGVDILRQSGFRPIILKSNFNGELQESDNEIALSGSKRFLAVSNLSDTVQSLDVVQRFRNSSNLFFSQFRKILSDNKYDAVIAHHGIYVPQGDVVKAAKENGTDVYTWVQGYRKSSYIFSKDETYHLTLMNDKGWDRDLSIAEKREIQSYLKSRNSGDNDWIRFGISTKEVDLKKLFPKYFNGKVFLLLTNVSWDAQLHYKSNTFNNMFDWLDYTLKYFISNIDQYLIIRIHPAEITGSIKSNEPVLDWINRNFSNLPSNISIISPDAEISTYSLMEAADIGLIYASKTGLEMLSKGKPVIVAGEAWIKNKGICIEPRNSKEYVDCLNNFRLYSERFSVNIDLVLKYAHYFFFRRTIEIKSIRAIKYYPYALPNLLVDWQESDPNLLKIVESIENKQVPQID